MKATNTACPPKGVWRLTPALEEEGERLDIFLSSHCPELSRGMIRKVIDLGGVHAGGRRVRRCSQPVHCGDRVEMFIDGQPLEVFSLQPEQVVFRDRWLLAINKPAGIDTNPTPSRYKGTLYEALLRFLHDPYRPLDRPELGMVQRLDRDTSGVLVFSVHRQAHRPLTTAFREREVKKYYRLLAAGVFPEREGEVRSLLARQRSTNRMKSVSAGGREAVTRFRVLEQYLDAAYLEVEILTGRSHQIRVHFSEAGHPLLGDAKYGGSHQACSMEIPRLMLHAFQLGFPHPISGEGVELTAPLPEDMETVLARFRKGLVGASGS